MKKNLRIVLLSFLALMPLAGAVAEAPISQVSENSVEPVVIIGGGIGSLTSALYLARAGMKPLVIEGPSPGGLLTQSHTVQNWPGEMEIDGTALVEKVRSQALANGAQFVSEEVIAVDFSKRPFKITLREMSGNGKTREMIAESCIIAMGTTPNYLGVRGEQKYWGRGVTNCAICDGSLYHDKVVGVVGGGDAAVLEALYLSNIAKEVHVFVRKDALRAIEEKRVQKLLEKPNVKIFYNTSVEEVCGDGENLNSVILKTDEKKPYRLNLDGLFLAIGSTPNSQIFQKDLRLDEKGYIVLSKDQQTSIEGIYAIGDIVDPVYKQAISAAGDGAKAALQVERYISDRANHLIVKQGRKKNNLIMAENQGVVANQKGKVIEISSPGQFEAELKSSKIPVVVDFYAPWCGPCKKVSPLFDSYAMQLDGKYRFLKVNVDNFSDLSSKYGIRAMPTVLLLDKSGKVKARKIGPEQIIPFLEGLK